MGGVYSVLARYAGRISRFSWTVQPESVGLDYWLIALSRRGVESIDLRSTNGKFRLHSSIFSCGHLVTLKLHKCSLPPLPPGFAGFPSLEELNFTNVVSVDKTVKLETIIRLSPSLQVLELSYVNFVKESEWVIQAPNLRRFTIFSLCSYDGWRFGELPRLVDATIDLVEYVVPRDFGKLLAAIAHVENLNLSTCYEPFNGRNPLENLCCTFHNLRRLFLYTQFVEMHAILSTFTLLRNAPNVNELEIMSTEEEDQEIEANAEFQNAQWTDGMCPTLQVVKMNGICFRSNEMCFIELVLSKATALRTMSIVLVPNATCLLKVH